MKYFVIFKDNMDYDEHMKFETFNERKDAEKWLNDTIKKRDPKEISFTVIQGFELKTEEVSRITEIKIKGS